MAVYYIKGTSNSGATFGNTGHFYPLYLTAAAANSASDNSAGTSHTHTFVEAPGVTFYMPIEDASHALANAPTGTYSGESYTNYLSPIPDTEIIDASDGVKVSDTFDIWRKKTNDVAKDVITNRTSAAVATDRLDTLDTTTGGASNIVLKTGNQTIAGDNTFSFIARFPGADDANNALRIGDTGKLHQAQGSGFIFNDTIDNSSAQGSLKSSSMEITSGVTTYNGVQYTWPTTNPTVGNVLKAASNNTLIWENEAATSTQQNAFIVEQLDKVGSVKMYAGATLSDDKYLFCQGQAVSRSTYSDLFSAIGTTYGAGDGSTTFNLPNLVGRVVVGLSAGAGNSYGGAETQADANNTAAKFTTLGGTTGTFTSDSSTLNGEYSHDITWNEMPAHGHALPSRADDGNFSSPFSLTNDTTGGNYADFTVTTGGPGGILAGDDRFGYEDNGLFAFRKNIVTGLAGGNVPNAQTRRTNVGVSSSGTSRSASGQSGKDLTGDASSEFIGAGYPQEHSVTVADGTETGGHVAGTSTQNNRANTTQPFIVLNYIIRAKLDNVAELHIKAAEGMLIKTGGNAANTFSNSTATNLLEINTTSSLPNEIKLDIDTADFKFGGTGSNQLQINPTSSALINTYRTGEVIEKFYERLRFGDGATAKTITLHGGTNYTLHTISQTAVDNKGVQLPTSTYLKIDSSKIGYVLPTNAKTVIYTYDFFVGRAPDQSPLINVRLYIEPVGGGTEVEVTEALWGHYHVGTDQSKFSFSFEIVETLGEENIAEGKIFRNNWEGQARNIFIKVRKYNANHDAMIHRLTHVDGSDARVFKGPVLGIETIAK